MYVPRPEANCFLAVLDALFFFCFSPSLLSTVISLEALFSLQSSLLTSLVFRDQIGHDMQYVVVSIYAPETLPSTAYIGYDMIIWG